MIAVSCITTDNCLTGNMHFAAYDQVNRLWAVVFDAQMMIGDYALLYRLLVSSIIRLYIVNFYKYKHVD